MRWEAENLPAPPSGSVITGFSFPDINTLTGDKLRETLLQVSVIVAYLKTVKGSLAAELEDAQERTTAIRTSLQASYPKQTTAWINSTSEMVEASDTVRKYKKRLAKVSAHISALDHVYKGASRVIELDKMELDPLKRSENAHRPMLTPVRRADRAMQATKAALVRRSPKR